MPAKLIFFIIVMFLITFFIGFNLENKTNLSVVFYQFEQIPVVVLMLASFCAGILFTLPFFFGRKKKSSQNNSSPKEKNDSGKSIDEMPV